MCKFQNILKKMPTVAMKSTINHKHSAVVLRNGVAIAWGFNSIKGNKTIHAEHDAIRNYLFFKGIKDNELNRYLLCK